MIEITSTQPGPLSLGVIPVPIRSIVFRPPCESEASPIEEGLLMPSPFTPDMLQVRSIQRCWTTTFRDRLDQSVYQAQKTVYFGLLHAVLIVRNVS